MQLKRLPTKETIGLILAHSTTLKNKRISKGTLLDSDIVRSLINAEISEVTCAVPDKGDIHEDEAANLIAMAIDKKKSLQENELLAFSLFFIFLVNVAFFLYHPVAYDGIDIIYF